MADIPRLKVKQIIAAPWRMDDKLTYSIIALGEDGFVYRFEARKGWTPIEDRHEWRRAQGKKDEESF